MASRKTAVTPLLTLELLQSCTKPSIYSDIVLMMILRRPPTVCIQQDSTLLIQFNIYPGHYNYQCVQQIWEQSIQ